MKAASGVWSRYRDNTARHLIGIARDLQHRTLRHLTEVRGYTGLRPSLGPLLSLVAREARSLGQLAAQLSISPQACSQVVNVGEDAGYLERQRDPADRRARRVALTPRGRALVADAVEILGQIESDYRGLIGASAYTHLTEHLALLFRDLELGQPPDPDRSASPIPSIGALPLLSVRVQRDLMEATSARGHDGLKMSHAQVLPLIGSDGARVHQLARVGRTSRQAVSATARDLEGLGYLERKPDPGDRRGVVFSLTKRGTRLIEDSVASLDAVDATFRDRLGASSFLDFQAAARDLYQALHLEEEIFEARSASSARVPEALRNPTTQSDFELEALADSLRRQLGIRGAERLAHLLEARA